MIREAVFDYLPLHVRSIDTIIFVVLRIRSACSVPFPYASVTPERAIYEKVNQREKIVRRLILTRSAAHVPLLNAEHTISAAARRSVLPHRIYRCRFAQVRRRFECTCALQILCCGAISQLFQQNFNFMILSMVPSQRDQADVFLVRSL